MSSRQPPEEPRRRKVGPKANTAAPTKASQETVAATSPGGANGKPDADSGPTSEGSSDPGEMATDISSDNAQPTGTEPNIGDLISGRYRLEETLGEGGMGKVFLAVDELYAGEFKDRQAQVALKFLGRKFASHSISRMALQRETRKSQQLAHPNVVRVMHFDQHDGNPYMIMEYMRGQPLDDFLLAKAADGLSLKDALKLIEGMALGLEYIHGQGLVHSDFKPNNVFVGEDGAAKILDLGIARVDEAAVEDQPETQFDASALGALTPTYASCEMFEGQTSDPRDDVYALACVIYELLAGHHPFDRVPAIKARADEMKPKRLEQLNRGRWQALLHGLAFNRAERARSAAVLLDGIQGEKSRRKLVLAGLAAAAGFALIAAISIGLIAMKPKDPDQVFLDELAVNSVQTEQLTAEDSKRIERWLSQGNAYLQIASDVFDQGDILSAHQILVEGADNALGAFTSVLKLTNSEEAKQGMMNLVNLYAKWTQDKLDQGDATKALWSACHGLSVHPSSKVLLELTEEARAAMPDAVDTSCVFMRTLRP